MGSSRYHRLLDSIYHNASVGVAMLDENAKFLMVNDAFCRFLGCSRQEILYKEVTQFLPLGVNDLEKALSDHLSGENSRMLEQEFVRQDGETVWGHFSVSMIRDEQQDCQHSAIVCEDVTSLKVKESELQAQSWIYEAMQGALQDIIQPPGQPGATLGVREPDAAGYEQAVVSRVIQIAREISSASWVLYYSYDAVSRMLCLTGNSGMPPDVYLIARAHYRYSLDKNLGLLNLVARERKSCTCRTSVAIPGGRGCSRDPILLPGAYSLQGNPVRGVPVHVQAGGRVFPAAAGDVGYHRPLHRHRHGKHPALQRGAAGLREDQQHSAATAAVSKDGAVGLLAGGIAHDLNNQLTVIQASVDLNMGLAPEDSSFSKAFKKSAWPLKNRPT